MKTFLLCVLYWLMIFMVGLGICLYFSLTAIPQVLLGLSLGAVAVIVCNWQIYRGAE